MWGNDNDISTTNTAHDMVVGIQSSLVLVIILCNSVSYCSFKVVSVNLVLVLVLS